MYFQSDHQKLYIQTVAETVNKPDAAVKRSSRAEHGLGGDFPASSSQGGQSQHQVQRALLPGGVGRTLSFAFEASIGPGGERTPVSARFQNVRVPINWPYCAVARRMTSMVATSKDLSTWDTLQWRRKIETFGHDDEAVSTRGPAGETEAICHAGELTDKGRQTTFELGQRLRHLYVDQLGFMPKIMSNAEDMYLRTSPIPRALESMQQAFMGMYPASARTADFETPAIVTRAFAEETVYPNDANCRRFRQLSRLFAERAAQRWNDTDDMKYLTKLFSKWMPSSSPRVAVDSHPRLSGIMDTINATLAHGPATRLPAAFYDAKALEIIDKIAVEEWYAGYKENVEYRRLGIGGLMGDVVDRMVSTALEGGWRSEVASSVPEGSRVPIKFTMSGCHDTTLAAVLSSLGAFDNERWPFFTSHISLELFSTNNESQKLAHKRESTQSSQTANAGLFSFLSKTRVPAPLQNPTPSTSPSSTARVPLSDLEESSRKTLQKYYVRIRYNDRPMKIPGCVAKTANHLPGDDSFCTLEAFKEIVDKFTPQQWQSECSQNLGDGIFGKDDKDKSVAGY
ncbi:acid phosphatase, putative [Talaromyces stipitatus ATCC 10500]|uniref:Acid phosphatase, putative n=1 Tax=Talaromyces stipitatus (strain ATCC 10500 / CBS 375.48 / QM 6759 / NRRL 1006) TaxID=441959 RepID=B8M0Q2_TALSN|nr:acid phosphatase, putative [Talaromyces stipitatus ATCC 10500]EED21435.1 acid phosphatase, putative [Talaromyces stipitatus ATCC 10500]